MESVKIMLNEQLQERLSQIVLSNPQKSCEASKIKIRPILIKEQLFFQETTYIKEKVIHKNCSKELMIEEIIEQMKDSFRQLSLESETHSITVLVSKKGTVTMVSKKKNSPQNKVAALEHNRSKKYILEDGIHVPFLEDLGVMNKDGIVLKKYYDKYRQMNRFLEFIKDILGQLPSDRKIRVLDFGCGKAYLTFAIYHYLKEIEHREVEMIGLDLKEDVIKHCNQLSEKYGYTDLSFIHKDIKDYHSAQPIDLVVTLHACDTATDFALAKAVHWGAKVILSVPCCQHELNAQIQCDQLQDILKYGLIKERMSALFTDAIRANLLEKVGYEVSIMEFIDMEHTPKNIMIRAILKNKKKNDIDEFIQFINASPTLSKLLES